MTPSFTLNYEDGQISYWLHHVLRIRCPNWQVVHATILWYACYLFVSWFSLSLFSQTSVLRAAAVSTPVYVFPAMNTLMYTHPLTDAHLAIVTNTLKYTVVGPIGKGLACGDVGEYLLHRRFLCETKCIVGTGAMTEWVDIVAIVVDKFSLVLKDTGFAS